MTKICTSPNCTNEIAPTSKYQCRECLDRENEKHRATAKNTRDARREKGVCIKCLNPAKEGSTMCEVCLGHTGKCKFCSNSTKEGNTMCEECARKKREKANALTADRKEAGLCVRCGEPAKEGIIHCEECAKGYSKRQRVKNMTDPAAKARKKEQGRRYYQAKRDGTYDSTGKSKFVKDIECDHIIPLSYFREAWRKEGWRNDLPEDDAVALGNNPINTRDLSKEENGSGGKHAKMTKEGWALLDYFGLPKLEWESYDE